jgi:hypothetical protein
MDSGFRRGDEWQHAITFGKQYNVSIPGNNLMIHRKSRRSSAPPSEARQVAL